MDNVWAVIGLGVLTNFISTILGVLAAYVIRDHINERRFGRWRARVVRGGKEIGSRGISARKAEELLEEEAELSVFLKGFAGAYGWINCDLVTDGVANGMLTIDPVGRVYTIDMDKNPPDTPQRETERRRA